MPFTGTIGWAGETLAGRTPASIASEGQGKGGIVQCPESRELFGTMSVRENLDLGGAHWPVAERNRQLDWLFGLFPILKSRANQAAGKMSGGEQQMLATCPCADDAAAPADPGRADPGPGRRSSWSSSATRWKPCARRRRLPCCWASRTSPSRCPHADRVYVLEHARIIWEGDPARFAQEAGKAYL